MHTGQLLAKSEDCVINNNSYEYVYVGSTFGIHTCTNSIVEMRRERTTQPFSVFRPNVSSYYIRLSKQSNSFRE